MKKVLILAAVLAASAAFSQVAGSDFGRFHNPMFSGRAELIPGTTLVLPNTTFSSQGGILYKNSTPWLHDFNYGNNGTVTTEGGNTFLGGSGNLTMGATATGGSYEASRNTGIGYLAGAAITTGYNNSLVGNRAGQSITSGSNHTAIGYLALNLVTTGTLNTAVGVSALYRATGSSNTAVGASSQLAASHSGSSNSSLGWNSLASLTSGSQNTAVGAIAGYGITTGSYNTIIGYNATTFPSSLSNNVIIGDGNSQQRIRSFPSLALTEAGGAETVLTLTSTTTNSFTVDVDYMVKATDATPDYAVRKGSVGLVCVNNATVVTCTPSATDQTNDGRNGGGSILINTNAKTLTYAITVDVSSANVAVLKFNIDSDMTVTAAGITMTVTINGIVTPS